MYDQSFNSRSFGEAAIFNVSVTRHGCHVRVFMFLAVLLKCTDGVHFLYFHLPLFISYRQHLYVCCPTRPMCTM